MNRGATIFRHAFANTNVIDIGFLSSKTSETAHIFPLYLYQKKDNPKKHSFRSLMMLFETQAKYQTRTPNLNKEFVNKIELTYKRKILPEQIFYYIYAVLYSNIYRKKYAEFLKIDFPRVPLTDRYELFQALTKLGEGLVSLHLLKSPLLNETKAKYPIAGNDKVEKVQYEAKTGKIYINQKQFFEGIPEGVWQYQIGGYQVLDKWLKDRQDRTLLAEEIEHYLKVITTIKHTLKLQKKIDRLYAELEK
ncbi:MAG: type ISP restriction/modification enzyme [Candidatus Edwardsbacteria bacterium]